MTRLAGILFSLVATTLMGIAFIVTLVIGQDTLQPILVALAIGFVLSVPATWLLTKKILEL